MTRAGKKAVIFDLFGTLVEVFSFREHGRMLGEVAGLMGVPYEDLRRVWVETYAERGIGKQATMEQAFAQTFRALGVPATEDVIDKAVQIRYRFSRRSLVPRHDSIETLRALRDAGCGTGLISDCAPDVPHLWQETPFASLIDVPVFSCRAGLKKPDPRIYELTCERLGVDAGNCIFVGDGGSHELTGASGVGMRAVCLRVEYEDTYADYDYPSDAYDWTGEEISTLGEVLSLIGGGAEAAG
jgi:putative hydrolase of the HAD superfamily